MGGARVKGSSLVPPTDDGSRQCCLDDGQRGVVGFVQDMHGSVPQQVLAQKALQALQDLHPPLLLRLALCQHQQGHCRQLRDQLRRCHLQRRSRVKAVKAALEVRGHMSCWKAPLTLKMQGMSFLVAWITSDARTELTEKSSSLEANTSGSVVINVPEASSGSDELQS